MALQLCLAGGNLSNKAKEVMKMVCTKCTYHQSIENAKKKNFSHYCLFSHTFMEKPKEQCAAQRPVKTQKPQGGEE